jgi:tetratricopeptide (TPR) repeat protein
MSVSPIVDSKLKWILDDAYPLARQSVIYSEVIMGELNYSGIAELRDVLDHIQRALDTDNEEDALKDLEAAYEHIRRGAVESLQRAATKTFFDALQVIRYPNLMYKILLHEVPDKGQIRDLQMKAMEKIADGRSHKSDKDKWKNSIEDFKDAIDVSNEIIDKLPNKAEFRFRLLTIVGVIIAIASPLLSFLYILFR